MSRRQRLVLKFGSGILSTPRGTSLDARQFARLTREVAELVHQGHQCVIVSSGAVAAGLAPMGLSARPSDLSAKQAELTKAQGQIEARIDSQLKQSESLVQKVPTGFGAPR